MASNKQGKTNTSKATTQAIASTTQAIATPAPVAPITGKFAGIAGKCAICGHTILQGAAGAIGHTCSVNMGKTSNYLPAPVNPANNTAYIALTTLCNYTQAQGLGRGLAVTLAGGDAGKGTLANPAMQIYTWGKRKYCKAGAMQWLLTYVQNLQASKAK